MSNIHYLNKLKLDTPIVCITTYFGENKERHGISIRYYAGDKDDKNQYAGHRMYSSGNSKNSYNQNDDVKYNYFTEFSAIVPLELFNAQIAGDDINYYLDNYKV